MSVPVSVLDTCPIVAGSTARQALHNAVDLAVLADGLGYRRYWVPEHHGMRGVASCATAVLVGRLADATSRIRVGAGGVLLPNHSPLVVAEQFGTLVALHPGRIDLGLGRAPGGPRHVVDVVRGERERSARSFQEQVAELVGYFDATEDRMGSAAVRAVPAIGNAPPVWLLGSSTGSARLAASLGLPYAFAHHLNPGGAPEALGLYRREFRAGRVAEPATVVSVSVIAADTDERAEWLAGSTRLKVLGRLRGRRVPLPSAAEAARHRWTDADRAEIADRAAGVLVGSAETVGERLRAVLADTGADEVMVTTPVHDHADRRRSYELVAGIALGA